MSLIAFWLWMVGSEVEVPMDLCVAMVEGSLGDESREKRNLLFPAIRKGKDSVNAISDIGQTLAISLDHK